MEVKPGYKQTEIGVIPEEWQVEPLGRIGDVKMCRRIFKHQTRSVADVPFYKIGTFGSVPDAFISQELFDEYKSKYSFPKNGEVLISAAGTIGRTVVYNGEPAYFQDSNIVWIDNDQTKVTNEYLWHLYKIVRWSTSDGGTVARLYNDNIKTKIYVSIPSIPEQRAIAEALSDVDGLLGGLDRLIAKKRDLKQAAMQQLLTGQTRLPGFENKQGYKETEVGVIPNDWGVRPMREFGRFAKGIGLLKEDIYSSGRIPAIPYTALYTDFSELINYDQIKWFVDESETTYLVCEPCVLIASSSNMAANTGKACALIGHVTVAIGREVIIFSTQADCRFVSYLLSTPFYRKQTLTLARGTTIKHLYPATFQNYRIAFPTLLEQTAIAEVLTEMDAELAALEQRREKTRALKQAMMQELLTGRIRLIKPESAEVNA